MKELRKLPQNITCVILKLRVKFQVTKDDLQQMDTVYFVDGISVRTKSSAVILCLKMMRFPYRFMAFLMWLCPKGIRNVAYDFVAKRRRSFFGTSDSCVWDAFPSNHGAEN